MIRLLLICVVAMTAQVTPPKGSIEGRVISRAGAPLKKAELTLRPEGNNANPWPTPYTASTGADGTFSITDLPPGGYMLSVSRVGYVDQTYFAKALKLDAGQKISGVEIQMTPQGMILGKALDEDGDPVPNLQMALQRWTYSDGGRRLVGVAYATSQADGSYVFGDLNAGRYILSAAMRQVAGADRITENADRIPQETNLPTFYPNSLDLASAVPLVVTAGVDLRGIDLRIRRGRSYEIRGHIQNETPIASWLGIPVSMWLKTDDQTSPVPRIAIATAKTADFQFKNLIPGTYVLLAVIPKEAVGDGTQTTGMVGKIEVTVSDANVNVVVPVGGGIAISGSIQGDAAAHAKPVLIQVNRVVAYASESIDNAEDGSFHARGLLPDLYRAHLTDPPEGSYIKGLRFNGQETAGDELDLSTGNGGELQILVSPNAADVAGFVRNENGDAVPTAIVQLFDDRRLVADTRADGSGAFHLKNLAPGEYKAFAWEEASSGVTMDGDFRKHFTPVVVKLAEKSHEKIDLKLIPKTAIETELAKFQ